MPSPDEPLTGQCACGTVRFEVTKPFDTAGYCHCKRCQRRSGALWTENAIVASDGFRFTAGEDAVRSWTPENGLPKNFCGECGGHLTGGGTDGPFVVVRLGTVDGDPGIAPQWHQYVAYAASWEEIPDDGLPRYPEGKT